MSQETLQPTSQANQAENDGLTAEQHQEAVELRERISERDGQLHQARVGTSGSSHPGLLSGNSVPGPSVISAWTGDIKTGVRSLQLGSAERAAERHYKKNMAGYQQQAAKEASEAGAEVTGWSATEDKARK